MTAPGDLPPRRETVRASAVLHAVVGLSLAVSFAAYAVSGGEFGAGRVMAAVLAGLAASGVTEFLGGTARDRASAATRGDRDGQDA